MHEAVAMSAGHSTRSGEEWRRGLPVVGSGLVGMAVQAAGYLSLGTMMTPLVAEFGWTRTQIVAVGAFSAILSIVMAPLVGRLLDRFGPRRVALIGCVAYPATLALAGLAGPQIVTWWAAWFVITITNFFLGPMVWTYAVTNSFARRRGLAIGIVLSGMGVANAVIPLFLVTAMGMFGWRGAYFALAGLVLIVGGGVTWRFFRMPASLPGSDDAQLPTASGMTLAQAMRTVRYWKLCLVVFLVSAGVGSLNIHLQPMLIDAGATMVGAAALASIFGPAQIVGRLLGGYLLDRVSGPMLGLVAFMLPVLSCAMILADLGLGTLAFLVPVCVGISAGVELDLATYLASRYFGPRHFGSIFSVIFTFFTIGYTLGPVAAAFVRDVSGGYSWVLIAIAATLPIAAAAVGTLGRYPDEPQG